MQDDPQYADVVDEVRAFLLERAARALRAGVGEVWIDPGIGFGKTVAHNLSLLRHLGAWSRPPPAPGVPGSWSGPAASASWGSWPHAGAGDPAPVADRAEGSLATEAAALVAGAGMVRVHDVAVTVQMTRLYGPAA